MGLSTGTPGLFRRAVGVTGAIYASEGELGNAVTVSAPDGDYLDRAIARLKKYGVPKGEDMLGWFGKLIVSEQINDRLGTAKEAEHELP